MYWPATLLGTPSQVLKKTLQVPHHIHHMCCCLNWAISRAYDEWSEKEQICCEQQLVSEMNGPTDFRRIKIVSPAMWNTITTTHWFVDLCRWTDHTACHSCQLKQKTGATICTCWPKIRQWHIGGKKKKLSGLLNLDFSYNIPLVLSEFGMCDIKAWIHPALYQHFKRVVFTRVQPAGCT